MAEPVEDDVSFLGIQEGPERTSPRPDCQVPSREYCRAAPEYHASEYQAAGALRAPVIASPSRQDRKNSAGRVLPSGSGDRNSPFSSSSPVASPRTPDKSPNYNIDASGSTYALQVALRNMKERYHKLQKKMALIEDDNQRLISGKSELFGEIGKLQENSIKLREKNLQLNQEIHTKHQECCSLKEKFSALSTENMNLTRQLAKTVQENRRLNKQVTLAADENKRLREKLSLISAQVKTLPGGASLAVSASELGTPPKTKIVPLSGCASSPSLFPALHGSNNTKNSPDYSENHGDLPSMPFIISPILKGKHVCDSLWHTEGLIRKELDSFNDPPTRFLSSHKDTLDDYEQISSSELGELDSWDDNGSGNEHLLISVQSATRRMRDLIANLQEQNHSLLMLSPLLHSMQSSLGSHADDSHRNLTLSREGTLGQRDRDMSTVTLTPSTEGYGMATEEIDDEGNCQSRLATCGSVLNPMYISTGALNT
ncbi:uncharacterized protein LOC135219980 isoform X2 [Macrobrachium nipponense]|uniref:uncharacterized protein LOC135219980 isoform X2 n=1 Tax=Macrobrachium nipponense TaxID=159736 RepID=UPI0030C87F2E